MRDKEKDRVELQTARSHCIILWVTVILFFLWVGGWYLLKSLGLAD